MRFIVVTGKGGVGKTTVSAILGLSISSKSKTVIYDQSENGSLFEVFKKDFITYKYQSITDSMKIFHIDWVKGAVEYSKLKFKFLLWLPFVKSSLFKSFSRAVPGFRETIVLGKIWYDGVKGRYDTAILDSPPTGQVINLLRIPEAIKDAKITGIIKNDVEGMYSMTKNCEIVLVTIPEELPIEETIEFIESAKSKGYKISCIVLNRYFSERLSEQTQNWIRKYIVESEKSREMNSVFSLYSSLSEDSDYYLSILSSTGYKVVTIPMNFFGVDMKFLKEMANRFEDY